MKISSDQVLTENIERHLEDKMQASAMDINVYVHNGVVQLQGFVDTLAEKLTAEEIARQTAGIQKVENTLTICTEGNINDKHIQKEVVSKLHSEKHGDLDSINVEIRDGSTVLIGVTENLAFERQAMQIASSTRGVKDVVSNIKIKHENTLDDTTITNRIVHALSTTHLSFKDICTDVYNGEVTLSGEVRTQDESQLAEKTASHVEGVRKIRNNLKVRGRQ